MSDIVYYKAGVTDAEILAQYRILFILEFLGTQPQSEVDNLHKEFKKYFEETIAEGSCIAYIAKSGDQIAGHGVLVYRRQPGNFKNPSGKVGYIMNMYTIPSFRRKGICTTILKALMDEARTNGITAFELHATQDGEPVYIKNNFYKHSEPTYRKYE